MTSSHQISETRFPACAGWRRGAGGGGRDRESRVRSANAANFRVPGSKSQQVQAAGCFGWLPVLISPSPRPALFGRSQAHKPTNSPALVLVHLLTESSAASEQLQTRRDTEKHCSLCFPSSLDLRLSPSVPYQHRRPPSPPASSRKHRTLPLDLVCSSSQADAQTQRPRQPQIHWQPCMV